MNRSDHRGADPEVLAAWVAGWAASRGVGPPRPEGNGHYVEVGLAHHRARYVFPTIGVAELRDRAEAIGERWVFLKVCLPGELLAAAWPAGWAVQSSSTMLTVALSGVGRSPSAPSGYRLAIREDGPKLIASMTGPGGDLAASGRLVTGGCHGILDQIITEEAHRRRGLGRCVMGALAGAALDRGAVEGVLVATEAGRRLYETLGWQVHAAYTSAVVPGDESGRPEIRSDTSFPT